MYYFSVERSGNQIMNNIMKEFWKGAYVNARHYGDSPHRVSLLKKITEKDEYEPEDLYQFSWLMTREEFEGHYPHQVEYLHKDCKAVVTYVQGFYIQMLKNDKYYMNQFSSRGKSDKNLRVMEKYMFDKIQKTSKELVQKV